MVKKIFNRLREKAMRYTRIKLLCIGLCISLLFFILVNGQAVVASKTSTTQTTQSSQIGSKVSGSVSGSNLSWLEILKIIGGSVLATIVAIITIYKFILEKRYDIESTMIYLICKKPLSNLEYTEFRVLSITREGKEVVQTSNPNPYYLDISVVLSIPDGQKLLNNIFVKKINFHINGYDLVCVPKIQALTGSKKCIFNKQNRTCEILLKWPTIKGGEDRRVQEDLKAQKDREALNQIRAFNNPETIVMHIKWYPQVIISSVVGFFLPKKAKIKFEKIEYENETPRIGIRSIGIFKEEKNG